MASRILLAQDITEDNQILKMDSITRYIVNDSNGDWQFLFNANSEPTNSTQVLKIAAQFDTDTLNKIRVAAYLYNTYNGTIDSSSGCTFKVFKIANSGNPAWDDQLIYTTTGVLQNNGYYFSAIDFSSLPGTSLDGDTTLMIEATATRLGRTYRDRVYANHLGVYGSILQLRQEVEFLDLTKLDE